MLFQHTAARRRLPYKPKTVIVPDVVSTHSRPKAAALDVVNVISNLLGVSTHSRPKAAAEILFEFKTHGDVSTHSRPKAAAVNAV